MDTNTLNWYAGFMDGEGTITIKRVRRGLAVNYLIMASCTQVDKSPNNKIIESFKDEFGGSVYRYIQSPNGKNCLNTIQWQITSLSAKCFLEKLVPYLRIKDKQANLALEFYEILLGKKKYQRSEQEKLKQERYFYKMRELNVKGKLRLQRLSEVTTKVDAIV